MTTLQRTATAAEIATPRRQMGTIVWKWMVTTDHKVIGNLYFVTSMVFFLFGGILAMAMRAELAFRACSTSPTRSSTSSSPCTAHVAAVRDSAVRRLRQRDHAAADRRAGCGVPRLNMIAYWFYLFGG